VSVIDAAGRSGARPATADRPWWKSSPLTWSDVGLLAIAYLAATAVYWVVGLLLLNTWEGSSLGEADADVSRWFEHHRTEAWTEAAHYGSALSNTETKIVLMIGLAPLMLAMYKRWKDWAWLTVALLLEVSVFGTTSELVARDRPPVEQLDGAPTNSWPSGHIAAALVFYVGLAVVIWRNRSDRPARIAAVLIAIAAPTAVMLSRLYLGMHFATDAIGGLVLGAFALYTVDRVMARRAALDPERDR
jgi:membrane-associated phospholipid phosphatase